MASIPKPKIFHSDQYVVAMIEKKETRKSTIQKVC